MNGSDRRTAAACPRLAARDSLYTAVRLVELDLDDPSASRSRGALGPLDPEGCVLALVRLHGHPLGLVTTTGTAGRTATLCRALVDAAHRERHVALRSTATPEAHRSRAGRARVSAEPPTTGVIVATHDRVAMPRPGLGPLPRDGYPRCEIGTVVSSPPSDAAGTPGRGRRCPHTRATGG